MEPTINQKLAIDIRDANVLVSAAAGSGKTSVLVERIVQRITDPNDPVDVDRLLIMTFTNAAAAEMRDRIREAIDARLEAINAGSDDMKVREMLEKQSILVHNAMITTIHGFCKSVITDHFGEVSIDPLFRVADDNEVKLIKQDALDECLENAYVKADPAFLAATEAFSGAKSDTGLADLVIPLYEFVMANPEPAGFLKDCLAGYEYATLGEFRGSLLLKQYEKMLIDELCLVRADIEKAKGLVNEYERLSPYRATVEAYIELLDSIDNDISSHNFAYDIIRDHIMSLNIPSFGRILTKNLDEDEIAAKKAVTDLRDEVKNRLLKLSSMVLPDLETAWHHIAATKPHLEALAGLVLDFSAIYDAKKREKNIIDFSDMEHMAIAILKNPKIADLYRERFHEIYIDEYQDSNMIQEELVTLICRHDPGNVFMVGDVKQSIYRFRQARPDLFLSKFNTYSDAGGENRRILLNDNFRSRREVVDAVNEVFSKIMKAGIGGIEYDEDAALSYGATYYESGEDDAGGGHCDERNPEESKKSTDENNNDYRAEIILCQKDELSPEELCANITAIRILFMIRSGYKVYDKKEKVMRPLSFKDITILVRSIKKYEPVFRDVFASVGIPLSVTGREGYFKTLEVTTALAFLSAVDNPYCDIELATLARCPVGGFTDMDLAQLSAAYGNKISLYERMKLAASISDETERDNDQLADQNQDQKTPRVEDALARKCSKLLNLLEHYRKKSEYTPVAGLLTEFIDSGYGDYVKCMSKASQRIANLEMLLAKAEDFGKTSFKGLYQFRRYMDQMRTYEIDTGEAGITSENDDVVKLMTMHASKGLEFPVCFIAGLEKRRNTRDESGKVIWNVNSGIGSYYTDTDRRICMNTLPNILVSHMNRIDSIAEEMRILYVAMTRAREKLIMIGCASEEDFNEGSVHPEYFRSYLEMLKAAKGSDGFRYIDVSYTDEHDLVKERFEQEIKKESDTDDILAIVRKYQDEAGDNELHTSADSIGIRFVYPYSLDPKLKAKLSVSELKHRAMEALYEEENHGTGFDGERVYKEDEPEHYIPKFMRPPGVKETGGSFYGTAFHRIMELWDYTITAVTDNVVSEFAERMHSMHRIDLDQLEAIRPGDVTAFLNSTLARRMANAYANGKLFREQPFVIGIPDFGEEVLVQGIIDAYFIEDDKIIIVDYKTDNVRDTKTLSDRYRTQLEYYKRALSQITNMSVAQMIIYSTKLGEEIIL